MSLKGKLKRIFFSENLILHSHDYNRGKIEGIADKGRAVNIEMRPDKRVVRHSARYVGRGKKDMKIERERKKERENERERGERDREID